MVVRYDGVPQTLEEFGLSGFIHTEDGAVVVGQPHVAATWFPVNDHPRDKASFTFRVAVPSGLEAIANGVLVSQRTRNGWTTWTWDAKEPMAPYLAGMGMGQFDVRAYQRAGIKYWDAIDSSLMADQAPPMTPVAGARRPTRRPADATYKRLTRVIDVPSRWCDADFQVNRDTEGAWDFLFVEARTPGSDDDWTTLPDANGHTSQDARRLSVDLRGEPVPGALPDRGAVRRQRHARRPRGRHLLPASRLAPPASGTRSAGRATAGSRGASRWPRPAVAHQVEVSITYASDGSVQQRGVALRCHVR